MTRHSLALCLLIFAACSVTAHAELLPAQPATLDSVQLHQKRAIDVFLPKDAQKEPARRYETIYVLDGDWNAKLVVQTVDFLQATGYLPPVIVVSVPNFFDDKGVNSRDRDLTPTPQPDQPRSGGAAPFMAFLKTELIPYVNQHYPTNGVNLIHGHSYGGLFLNYVIANDPGIFDGYLILDPAMWWDDRAVTKRLVDVLPSTPTQGKGVFIAGRAGNAFKGMGIDSLESAFKQAPPALHRQIAAYPSETHDSMKFKGTYDGLRYLYRGYSQDKITIGPDDGIVDPTMPFPLEADTDRFDIHYTIDGSTPTFDSPRIDQVLAVTDPANLRLKVIATRSPYDADLAVHLKTGTMMKPARAARADEKSAYRYSTYAADRWPRFRGAPTKSGTTANGDLDKIGAGDFAVVAEDDYVIPEDGYYIFVVSTPHPARLTLNGRSIVERAEADVRRQRTFAVPLRAGIYKARFEFVHKKGDDVDFHVFHFKDGTWDNVVK